MLSEPQQSNRPPGQSPMAFASLGLELVVTVVLLTYGGYWLDDRLGTLPVFVLIGVFLGMAVGFYNVFRRVLPKKEPGGHDGKDGKEG